MPRLACSPGVFFGRANVFARESAMLKLFLLSPIFHCREKSKMAATTIRTRTMFRPPKIRLHCRLCPSVGHSALLKDVMLLTLWNISTSCLLRFYSLWKWECKKTTSSLLDSRNLITLINDDSSESRNLNTAKYFYSKFAKLKSRENK